MYYIINIITGKILSFGPEGPFKGIHSSDNMIWVEEAYHCCYFDTQYDAEVAIKLLIQYGKMKKGDLEVRKMIHG